MSETRIAPPGRYRLDERIAAGSVGEVWRGADEMLHRPVAIKLLRPEFGRDADTLARFRAEARHIGALSHPAIAQIYDYVEDYPPYLVMELVDGPSLAGLLARGPLTPARTMDVIAQAADGLAAAHAAGVVHRDIKPGNLLVSKAGQVKITDFGIANAAGSAPLTRAGTVLGTPAYLAPERVAGAMAGPAADLYSLGIVAYECLTGAPPFSGEPLEVARAHRFDSMPPLPVEVPGEVAQFVAELTAKNPAGRPASAQQVAARARQLRDRLASPATRAAAYPAEPVFAGPAADHVTLTDLQVPNWAAEIPRHRTAWRGWTVAAVVVATGLVAGLVGWLGGSMAGTAQHQRHVARPAAPATAAQTVSVNPSSLVDQPVSQVRTYLAGLGLVVNITWQTADGQPLDGQQVTQDGSQLQGTVTSVQPSGQVRVGSTITITATPSDNGNGNGGQGGGN